MILIRKLDQYLLKSFLSALLVVVMAIGLTIIVINMVEELRDFIDHHVPFLQVLQYYAYFGGWVVKSFLPVFVLLATLFSVSILARRNEILAMKANGLSLYRVALPYFFASIMLAVGHFYYNEYIFPPLNQRRLEIKEFTIERRSKDQLTKVRNLYRQISPGYFYTLANFDADRNMGQDFKLYKTSGNQLRSLVTAQRIEYADFQWHAFQGSVRIFEDSLRESYERFDTMTIADIADKPEDLMRRLGKPEDMGLVELKQYIDLMKRAGGPHLRESIDLRIKYSYPVSSVIVILICLPFASNPRRAGVAVSFALGAVLALLYFILFRVMQSAGYNEKIPADFAVWGVNSVFFLIGIVLMLKARK
ncbi:MAG: LptF/LptG family permease [Candidatus Zixiibacteriota bacterium]